jgi:hypothetical protein
MLRSSAFLRYTQHNLMLGQRLEHMRRTISGLQAADPELVREARVSDSKQAIDYFLAQLPARSGLEPRSILLVLDAIRPAIYSEETLRRSESGYHAQMRRYLDEHARALGFQVIDLQPVFIARHRRDHTRFEFPTDKHWNELGQQVAAGEIGKSAVFSRLFGSDAPFSL